MKDKTKKLNKPQLEIFKRIQQLRKQGKTITMCSNKAIITEQPK